MAAHRYWRVLGLGNTNDSSYTGISEIEMRLTAGGADQCTGGTAAASAGIQAGSAAACFDNNASGTGIQWNMIQTELFVSYDFGAGNEKDIIEFAIAPRHDAVGRTPASMLFQYSDDNSTWTTAWIGWNTTWSVGTLVVFTKPAPGPAAYWRVRPTQVNSSQHVMACAELEFRATPGGADQSSGGTASAQSTFGGFPASNAFDNNSSSIWSGDGATAKIKSCWLQYLFPGPVSVNEVAFTSRSNSSDAANQSPIAGSVEYSHDGLSFMQVWAWSGSTSWTPFETRVFTNPGYNPSVAKRRRMVIVT